jgi:hypothetical protein
MAVLKENFLVTKKECYYIFYKIVYLVLEWKVVKVLEQAFQKVYCTNTCCPHTSSFYYNVVHVVPSSSNCLLWPDAVCYVEVYSGLDGLTLTMHFSVLLPLKKLDFYVSFSLFYFSSLPPLPPLFSLLSLSVLLHYTIPLFLYPPYFDHVLRSFSYDDVICMQIVCFSAFAPTKCSDIPPIQENTTHNNCFLSLSLSLSL